MEDAAGRGAVRRRRLANQLLVERGRLCLIDEQRALVGGEDATHKQGKTLSVLRHRRCDVHRLQLGDEHTRRRCWHALVTRRNGRCNERLQRSGAARVHHELQREQRAGGVGPGARRHGSDAADDPRAAGTHRQHVGAGAGERRN